MASNYVLLFICCFCFFKPLGLFFYRLKKKQRPQALEYSNKRQDQNIITVGQERPNNKGVDSTRIPRDCQIRTKYKIVPEGECF